MIIYTANSRISEKANLTKRNFPYNLVAFLEGIIGTLGYSF